MRGPSGPLPSVPPVGFVGIGASLGGLEAVERLLGRLPTDFPAAVGVVLHRSPDGWSRLAELLGKHSALPVTETEDKTAIVPGHVYLAPANYHMLVDGGALSLSVDAPVCCARPSIDVLFETLGRTYGERGVAVSLTGSSEDGANGAAAARRLGARVVVQDPDTAQSPLAPQAVLTRAGADFVGTLDAIVTRLADWCNGRILPSRRPVSPRDPAPPRGGAS